MTRDLTPLEMAVTVLVCLAIYTAVLATGDALRSRAHLAVTCRYAMAGTTPAMRQELSRTLSWCRGTEEAQ